MHAVEAWAESRGAREVELVVFEFNDGVRAFYEELGCMMLTRRMGKTISVRDGGRRHTFDEDGGL